MIITVNKIQNITLLSIVLILQITCEMSFWSWRDYNLNGNDATINSIVIEGNSIVLITSYNNVASFMERKITPKIGELVKSTFRSIHFPSVEYSNYQIRAYRKN